MNRVFKHIDPGFDVKDGTTKIHLNIKGDSPADMVQKTIAAILSTCNRVDDREKANPLLLAIQISIQTKLTINIFPALIGGIVMNDPQAETFLRWEDKEFDKCGCTACCYAISGAMFLQFADRFKGGHVYDQEQKHEEIRQRMLAAASKDGRPRNWKTCPFIRNGLYDVPDQFKEPNA